MKKPYQESKTGALSENLIKNQESKEGALSRI